MRHRTPVTPSLFAPDLAATVHFFVDTLGFEQTGAYQDGDAAPTWAEVALGDARIWFFSNPLEQHPVPAFSGLIYLYVPDVDQYGRMLAGKVDFAWGPETQAYGLRELGIRDINGYYLVFATDV